MSVRQPEENWAVIQNCRMMSVMIRRKDIIIAHDPTISDATFPNTVVVVVAAYRTPRTALFNSFLGFMVALLSAWPSFRVSERPGMLLEC